jgi:hypothetical protein
MRAYRSRDNDNGQAERHRLREKERHAQNREAVREYQRDYYARTGKVARQERKLALIELLGGACKCGFDVPAALQFHHIDPATKEFTIANKLNRPYDELEAEALKCELLCANCHAIHHSEW